MLVCAPVCAFIPRLARHSVHYTQSRIVEHAMQEILTTESNACSEAADLPVRLEASPIEFAGVLRSFNFWDSLFATRYATPIDYSMHFHCK